MKTVGLILYIEVFTSKILINDRYAVHQVWVSFGRIQKMPDPQKATTPFKRKTITGTIRWSSIGHLSHLQSKSPLHNNPVGINLPYLGKKTNADYDSFLK